MTQERPDLSIVTVNWNTRDLTVACVKSVRETVKKHTWEFIVVDNNSQDDSVAIFKRDLPDVKLIQNDYNAGSTRANNQGMKVARGRYVMMLNSDTICTPGALDRLVDFMDSRSDVGAVCGQLLNADGSNQRSYDVLPTPLTELGNKSLLKLFFPNKFPDRLKSPTEPIEVEQIISAAIVIRRETLEQTNYLDERFFLFLEETDWALRARQAGWKLYHVPDAKIYHLQGQSMNKRLALARIEYFRSRYQYFDKHYGRIANVFLCLGIFLKLNVNLLAHLLLTIFTLGLASRIRVKTYVYLKLWWWHVLWRPDSMGLIPKEVRDALRTKLSSKSAKTSDA